MSEEQLIYGAGEMIEPEVPGFMDHSPMFDGAKAILCVAVYMHVEPECFESLTIAMSRFGREQVRFMSQEKTLIHESRNRLAHRFLETDSDWMIFIDADMAIPCGNATYFNQRFRQNLPERIAGVNSIQRLLSHPSSMGIVGATYFDRQFGTQIQCSRGCGSQAEPGFNDRYRRGEITGVHEVLWTATGGMRIHRSVFDAIKKNKDKFPEILPIKEGGIWGFFTPNRVGLGEDVAFCYRTRLSGIKVWQDFDLRFLHKGHCWR
jgi:hypothetical protein